MPIDLFTSQVPDDRLNRMFIALRETAMFAPAKAVMADIAATMRDVDGNFVKDFQTTGFDGRLWELYLCGFFGNESFKRDESHDRPDFCLEKNGRKVFLEAVTTNAPQTVASSLLAPTSIFELESARPLLISEEDWHRLYRDEIPARLAASLEFKVGKAYHALPHVQGHPLILAIEAFHDQVSLRFDCNALAPYLYGERFEAVDNGAGGFNIVPRKVEHHVAGKRTILSGFFNYENTRHVSAVLFSNSGTISKFNRLGYQTTPRDDLQIWRLGQRWDRNPRAKTSMSFAYKVGDPRYRETWGEGVIVYHNPNALVPFDRALLRDAAHEWRSPDGTADAKLPNFFPFGSLSYGLVTAAPEEIVRIHSRIFPHAKPLEL